MSNATQTRLAKLNHFFKTVVDGKVALKASNYKQFLEAVCSQADPAVCIYQIHGKGLIAAAVRLESSPSFFNGPIANLLKYLSAPEIGIIGGGSMLKDMLISIVEPPEFWSSILQTLKAGQLDDDGKLWFSWLLYRLLLSDRNKSRYRLVAEQGDVKTILLSSAKVEGRNMVQKILNAVSSLKKGQLPDENGGPGGRHDNDFTDFRSVSVVPTADEIQSNEPAFLSPLDGFEDEKTTSKKENRYLESQFRLLREDMIYEIREEIKLMKERKQSRNFILDGLRVVSAHYMPERDQRKRGVRWGIVLECFRSFPQMRHVPRDKRMKWLGDNRNFFRHQSVACLLVDEELVALATIERDEGLLAKDRPQIVVHFEGDSSVTRSLLKMKVAQRIKLVQINAAIFAYEPILKALQETKHVPLPQELLFWKPGTEVRQLQTISQVILDRIENTGNHIFSVSSRKKVSIQLDSSQHASLCMGLTQALSLIQGPPGTGKSFIGALLSKYLLRYGRHRILVVCYTNHALDQFLEDLLDIGIDADSMVRLGGKSTDRTKSLSLHNSPRSNFTQRDWDQIKSIRSKIEGLNRSLKRASHEYNANHILQEAIMGHLKVHESEFYRAFQVPPSPDDLQIVTKNGKPVFPNYLIDQWSKGRDAGVFKNYTFIQNASRVWKMNKQARLEKYATWNELILKGKVEHIHNLAKKYDAKQAEVDAKHDESVARVLASKSVIGCTTTAAAKYRQYIHEAAPDILLVEEAGEILEPHIVTALGSTIKKLILIGDHRQLRPKVNKYELTVEQGDGFDLNRSLFERLILKGYPHQTLSQQHRMRPEISTLVRHLTYPELIDHPKTANRPDIRGLTDNVIFVNHNEPEDDLDELKKSSRFTNETGLKASKRNKFEVAMVLKILRYLKQQNYPSENIVILTPYLGQLRALQMALKDDNDPVLNELDSVDLIRAGLDSPNPGKTTKESIRLATIDNYQGEESDIVIASLTRSNPECKIGFMAALERVNVLLSRARNGLILIGNANTFMKARHGGDTWTKLLELLAKENHMYEGLPVKCQQHPERTAILKVPGDFDRLCPDGGCGEPCGVTLSCGLHKCTSKCHQKTDHTLVKCRHTCFGKCGKKHLSKWECHQGPPKNCIKCIKEEKEAESKEE